MPSMYVWTILQSLNDVGWAIAPRNILFEILFIVISSTIEISNFFKKSAERRGLQPRYGLFQVCFGAIFCWSSGGDLPCNCYNKKWFDLRKGETANLGWIFSISSLFTTNMEFFLEMDVAAKDMVSDVWRLVKPGSSQVGSLTVGKLVFGSRSAHCGRSQTINISHKLISASCVRYFIFRKSQSVSVWPSYATRNSNQAPMSSAFMIECPLRLNNEHNNRGRLCNEKYSYTGAEKRRKNVLRMRVEYTHTLLAGETQIFVKNACRRLTSNFAWRGTSYQTTAHDC